MLQIMGSITEECLRLIWFEDNNKGLCEWSGSRSVVSDFCDPMDCCLPGSSVHGDSPGQNARGGSCSLLQGIFPVQGSNPSLLHCRQNLYHQPPGKPWWPLYNHCQWKSGTRQCFSTRGGFISQKTCSSVWDTFSLSTSGRCALGILWLEIRDAAVHSTAPNSKELPTRDVSGAAFEKLPSSIDQIQL